MKRVEFYTYLVSYKMCAVPYMLLSTEQQLTVSKMLGKTIHAFHCLKKIYL